MASNQLKEIKDFTIELITQNYNESSRKIEYSYIPITTFENGNSSIFSTYEEQLVEKEKGQCSLTFKITKYSGSKINPFFLMIANGRRLRLTTTGKQPILFVISSLTPEFSASNFSYSVSCQDVFSYELSKQAVDITYETVVPDRIDILAKEWLKQCKIDNRWVIDPTLEAKGVPDFPSDSDLTSSMVSSLSLSNTSAYNGLVEIANLFDAEISVTYNRDGGGTIYFINIKKSINKGYYMKQGININSLSVSSNTENFCSVLHVLGSEDADGARVGISNVPPDAVRHQFLMNEFVYFIPSATEDTLKNLLSKMNYDYIYYCSDIDAPEYEVKRYPENTVVTNSWVNMGYEEIIELIDNSASLSETEKDTSRLYFENIRDINPSAGNYLYCFDLFKNNKITHNYTIEKLERRFDTILRNYNMAVSAYTYLYYLQNSQLQALLQEESDYVTAYAAEQRSASDYKQSVAFDYTEILDFVETEINAEHSDIDYDNIDFSSDTYFDTIMNGKVEALSNLKENVWNNDKTNFFTLIANFHSVDYFKEKMEEFAEKISEFQSVINKNNIKIDKIISDNSLNIDTHMYYDVEKKFNNITESDFDILKEECRILSKTENGLNFDVVALPIATTRTMVTLSIGTFNKFDVVTELYNKGDYDTSALFTEYITNNEKNQINIEYYTAYKAFYDFLDKDGESGHVIWDKEDPSFITGVKLVDRLEILNEHLSNIWKDTYNLFGDFIIESSFEDSNQLSQSGLITSALKAFATYQIETNSYSSEIINFDKLTNNYTVGPEIGDKIVLYTEELNQLDSRNFTLIADDFPRTEYFYLEKNTYYGLIRTLVKRKNFEKNSNEFIVDFEYNGEDDIFSFNMFNNKKVKAIYPSVELKKIELTISEISRNLREDTTSLTIYDNKTIDNLIDRLLFSVRR